MLDLLQNHRSRFIPPTPSPVGDVIPVGRIQLAIWKTNIEESLGSEPLDCRVASEG
jgi:hypothetical protein